MSEMQCKRRRQIKQARLEIVAKMYKRGYSQRQIAAEVSERLNVRCGKTTVQNDIHTLLDEWRACRVEDVDEVLQLELERIDDAVRELWEQWEKSKEDYARTNNSRKGIPQAPAPNAEAQQGGIVTVEVREDSTNVVGLGNPAYIAEIRQQLAERRKLLGIYAPEKRDISGDISFANMLVESGKLDEAEKGIEKVGFKTK